MKTLTKYRNENGKYNVKDEFDNIILSNHHYGLKIHKPSYIVNINSEYYFYYNVNDYIYNIVKDGKYIDTVMHPEYIRHNVIYNINQNIETLMDGYYTVFDEDGRLMYKHVNYYLGMVKYAINQIRIEKLKTF